MLKGQRWQIMQRLYKAVNIARRTLVDLHLKCSFQWRLHASVKKLLNPSTKVINLIKVLIFPCVWTRERRLVLLFWKDCRWETVKFRWLKLCIRPVCEKKKSALHHPPFHSRGKWPSLQWWHKDCVSYLMPVIFWCWSVRRDVVRNSQRHNGYGRSGVNKKISK